jgi:hypothetical protein
MNFKCPVGRVQNIEEEFGKNKQEQVSGQKEWAQHTCCPQNVELTEISSGVASRREFGTIAQLEKPYRNSRRSFQGVAVRR